MNHFMNTIRDRKGFTLIETLFAILIFSAALVSLLVIAGKGINATGQIKNETVAFYLAQEGLETVRNIRDSNFVTNVAWDTGFAGTPDCAAPAGCYLDFTGSVPVLAAVGNSSDTQITFNNGLYSNQPGDPTAFSRYVQVIPVANGGTPDEYTVISKVSWNSRGITRTVELTTLIKKWR